MSLRTASWSMKADATSCRMILSCVVFGGDIFGEKRAPWGEEEEGSAEAAMVDI